MTGCDNDPEASARSKDVSPAPVLTNNPRRAAIGGYMPVLAGLQMAGEEQLAVHLARFLEAEPTRYRERLLVLGID